MEVRRMNEHIPMISTLSILGIIPGHNSNLVDLRRKHGLEQQLSWSTIYSIFAVEPMRMDECWMTWLSWISKKWHGDEENDLTVDMIIQPFTTTKRFSFM